MQFTYMYSMQHIAVDIDNSTGIRIYLDDLAIVFVCWSMVQLFRVFTGDIVGHVTLISYFQTQLAAARAQNQVPIAGASQQTPADTELQRLQEELRKAQWSYEALEERSSEEEQRLMVSEALSNIEYVAPVNL